MLGGHGDEKFRLDADGLEKRAIILFDLLETRLGVVLQIHLVDQHGDLPDAEQIEQITVTARLLLDAFVGVNEQQGGLGVGRAGDHVLEKFLVARARQ